MRTLNIYKTLVIASILILAGLEAYPQKAFLFGADATVPKTDSVVIRLNGYVGEIQWQKTHELIGKDDWVNIPNATFDTLVFIADTTTFFRAQVISGHCDPFYSDTTFINVYKQNNNVLIVNDNDLTLVSDSTQLANGIFVYEGDASEIEIGSVIVSSIGEGYMRIVTGIQSKNSKTIVLETEQAVLTDVIQEINLSDSLVLTFDEGDKRYAKAKPIHVQPLYLIEGAKIKPDKSGFDLSGVSFNIAVEDENSNFSGSITATITEGHINFQPVFHRELEISWLPPRVNKFGLSMGGNIDFDMLVSLEAEVAYSVDTTYTLKIATIGPIFIGPVPMLLTISLDFSFEAGLNVSGEMTFGFESDYSASAGASYIRGNSPEWNTLFDSSGSFNSKPFDFAFNANAFAQFGVAPKASTKIAGIAGPVLAIEPYLRADLDASWPLDWGFSATAGVDASLGFEVGILSHSLLKLEASLEGPSWTIFEINGEYEHIEPVVETLEITSITHNSAQSGGIVTIEGASDVIDRGIVWSNTENPTVDNNMGITSNGSGIGSYTSNITGLAPATTYYVKAFATNNEGTSYGEQKQFVTNATTPTVNSYEVTSITSSSAMCGGSISSNGGATVTARGVVWNITENPTIVDNLGKTTNGTGTGNFTSNITGLTHVTTYYVRAYATNSVGTSYGVQREFTTLAIIPTLTTNEVTNITNTSATSGGNITYDGGATVIDRGVVWGNTINPTIDNNLGITNNGNGPGSFNSSITGLTNASTYYVRAYATNNAGTGYGVQQIFTTLNLNLEEVFNPATGKIWMDRNLGASRVAESSNDTEASGDLYQWGRATDGHEKRFSGSTSSLSNSNNPGHGNFILSPDSPFDWISPQNDNLWQGESGQNNPCPTGFRLPTIAEWEAERLSWNTNNADGAFASPLKLPITGERLSIDGSIVNEDSYGNYWSSTFVETQSTLLSFNISNASTIAANRAQGISVRCIRDNSLELTTNTVSNISFTTATSGGNITSDDGSHVITRGVVWSTTENPTVESYLGITIDGSGMGSFTSYITGLEWVTTYYVRAYATNSVGTRYGNQQTFTTTGTVIVEVTNPVTGKIWMDRNLGATRAATSSTDAQAYGDLYQWGRYSDGHEKRNSGTTNTSSTSDTPGHDKFILATANNGNWRGSNITYLWQGVSGVNNPCPTGYRLPTTEEWQQEILSWSSNNADGAFASPLKLPVGGNRSNVDGILYSVDSNGYYWSSSTQGARSMGINFGTTDVITSESPRAVGQSVRCIKN
ncbi:MAG: hypothetical protein KGZ97_07640 [Bacteroidetes bacterium]|nr:hypothetical protein [Bacteroidota bacterium]